MLGLYYKTGDAKEVEHTEGRKNILEEVTDLTGIDPAETAWLPTTNGVTVFAGCTKYCQMTLGPAGTKKHNGTKGHD